jgi:hypothetical protein
MAIFGRDFSGCAVQVYDMHENLIESATITFHDTKRMEIELSAPVRQGEPDTYRSIQNSETYKVLILSKPIPCEYEGIARVGGLYLRVLALYHGKEKENRKDTRYKVNMPAVIRNLIYHDRAYTLHTPLHIQLINISKSGMRLSAAPNTLSLDDCLEIEIEIGGKQEQLLARVVNVFEQAGKDTQYGCLFLAKGMKIERVV